MSAPPRRKETAALDGFSHVRANASKSNATEKKMLAYARNKVGFLIPAGRVVCIRRYSPRGFDIICCNTGAFGCLDAVSSPINSFALTGSFGFTNFSGMSRYVRRWSGFHYSPLRVKYIVYIEISADSVSYERMNNRRTTVVAMAHNCYAIIIYYCHRRRASIAHLDKLVSAYRYPRESHRRPTIRAADGV